MEFKKNSLDGLGSVWFILSIKWKTPQE
jgi:hypothetical protein